MAHKARLHLHFENDSSSGVPFLREIRYRRIYSPGSPGAEAEDIVATNRASHGPDSGFDWQSPAVKGLAALVLRQIASGHAIFHLTQLPLAEQTVEAIRRGHDRGKRPAWLECIFGEDLDNRFAGLFLFRTGIAPWIRLGSDLPAASLSVTLSTDKRLLEPDECGDLAERIAPLPPLRADLTVEIFKGGRTRPDSPPQWVLADGEQSLPLKIEDLFRISASLEGDAAYLYLVWFGGESGTAALLYPRDKLAKGRFPIDETTFGPCRSITSPNEMQPDKIGWFTDVKALTTDVFILIASRAPIPQRNLAAMFQDLPHPIKPERDDRAFDLVAAHSNATAVAGFSTKRERGPPEDMFDINSLKALPHLLHARARKFGGYLAAGICIPSCP